MAITVEGATKHFGDFLALDDVSIDVPDGSLTLCSGPAAAQVDAAALHRRPRGARHRDDPDLRSRCDPGGSAGSRRGLRLPALRRLQAHDRWANVGFAMSIRNAPRRRSPPARRADAAGPSRGIGRPLPLAALRRPAPAHGSGPGARGRAEGAAAGRALRALDATSARSFASGFAAFTTRST